MAVFHKLIKSTPCARKLAPFMAALCVEMED